MEEELHHIISHDSKGRLLDGAKKYKLLLPANIPASHFWSVIVYDPLDSLIIHTDQAWPSVHSNNKNIAFNADGSIDIWFGPEYIEGEVCNFVKTIPGKHWYTVLRLYYPLKSWFDKSWKPGEIEEII